MIYLIGSLRNLAIGEIGMRLRDAGFEVFNDWHSAGPNADDHLRDHYRERGMDAKRMLQAPAAQHIFEFDKKYLKKADTVVLAMPAGKSGFLELGWALGQGKKGYILFDQEPERIDIMFQFADGVFYSIEELVEELNGNTNRSLSSTR